MSAVPTLPVDTHVNGSLSSGSEAEHILKDKLPVDHARSIRVIVIGAGFSGIYAGVRIPQRLKNVSFTIYEKNAGNSGTWYENRYPGCACDIPAHSYQFSFATNHSWSKFYAPAPEIRAYMQGVAESYGATRFIKNSHRVLSAIYNEDERLWHVRVLNSITGDEFEDTCNILWSARGLLNTWKWPSIPGLKSFKGHLVHSANWRDTEWKNKKVGIIGLGSSAIQIIPALQKEVGPQGTLISFARGRTWIATPFAGDEAVRRNPTGQNYAFTEEEVDRFKNDPEYYNRFRKDLEVELGSVHSVTLRGSPLQKAAVKSFGEIMRRKLEAKPGIADALIPEFPVACRRLTPGPGFLEALASDNVNFINVTENSIVRVTPEGVELASGEIYELDCLVCATGFETSGQTPFPIIGRSGLTLSDRHKIYPESYLSLAVDGFPNFFQQLGTNSGVGSGSLTIILERIGDYIIQAIRKMQREGYDEIEVKALAVKDFSRHIDEYFPATVHTENCRSWYRHNSEDQRITELWPGSTTHALQVLQSPRWEDFEYKLDKSYPHTMNWLGNGWTNIELEGGDPSFYLENVDFPPNPRPEVNIEKQGSRYV